MTPTSTPTNTRTATQTSTPTRTNTPTPTPQPLVVSVLPQKYTLMNGGSASAPLYIEVQVYNPLTGTGIAGVAVTIYLSKNGVAQSPITLTTDANGLAKVCVGSYAINLVQ